MRTSVLAWIVMAAAAGAAAAQTAPGSAPGMAPGAATGSGDAAGSGFAVCADQQDIEQYLQTGGELVPEGCRMASVIVVESDGRRICAVDLGSNGDGVLDQIRDVATTTTWWADCAALAGELP